MCANNKQNFGLSIKVTDTVKILKGYLQISNKHNYKQYKNKSVQINSYCSTQ